MSTLTLREKRMLIWRHNGLRGSARMMMANASNVINTVTTTDESRKLAEEIRTLANRLYVSLGTRRPFPDSEN